MPSCTNATGATAGAESVGPRATLNALARARPRPRLETGILISSLLSLSLLLGGCGSEEDGGSNTTGTEIAAKETQWQALNIVNYTLAYRVECVCPTKRVTVEVDNGVLTRHTFDSGDPGFDNQRDDYLFTVTDLFRETREANQNAHYVRVAYSPEYGFPIELRVDKDDNGIDDVQTIQVTRFERR